MKPLKIILRVFIFLVVVTPMLGVPYAKAQAPYTPMVYNKSTIDNMIGYYASNYNVSPRMMDAIVSCETGGTYDVKQTGDFGTSLGLVQIHLPAHPDISAQEAENPYFSLDYLASNLSKGQGSQWTTYEAIKHGGSYTFYFGMAHREITIHCEE